MTEMKHNYHTHTPRCNHALGNEREYVEAAIAAGFETLGFSDHSPYLFPEEAGTYYSSFRMRPEQLRDYVESVERLKKEYAGKIRIFTGVEIEYYPKCFDKTEKFLKDAGVEYMIIGQHVYGNEFDEGSVAVAGAVNAPDETFVRYTDLLIDCIKSKKFLYIGHPDMYRFGGDIGFYRKQVERLCEASKEYNVPLEVNLLGYGEKRWYPRKEFWLVAGEVGCPVIFGVDAHRPSSILSAEAHIEEFKKEYEGAGLKFVEDNKLL